MDLGLLFLDDNYEETSLSELKKEIDELEAEVEETKQSVRGAEGR